MYKIRMSATPFKTVHRDPNLAEQVTRQIESLIVADNLQPGDRLPPERELAQQFGVSRTVVRQAIHSLVAKSLLETLSSGGAVVRRPTAAAVAQSLHLFLRSGQAHLDYGKVHEVRRLLEVEIAALAAIRRTVTDLAQLEDNLRAARDSIANETPDHFAQIDIAFHAILAQATHNGLFALLLDSLVEIMLEVRRSGFAVPDTPARALRMHQAIYEQVRAGDAEGARRAMHAHLLEAEETQRQVLALKQSEA
jgi:GntR family transcriptional repressor for pyruvate dehydrogenase complex